MCRIDFDRYQEIKTKDISTSQIEMDTFSQCCLSTFFAKQSISRRRQAKLTSIWQ